MEINDALKKQITQIVLEEVKGYLSKRSFEKGSVTSADYIFKGRLLTESKLRELASKKAVNIQIGLKTIVTPSAKDFIKEKGLTVICR